MPSIHETTNGIISCFGDIGRLPALPGHDAASLWLKDQETRFSLWASNIGAHLSQENSGSADFKSRKTPEITERFQRALDELQETLQDASTILSGKKKGSNNLFHATVSDESVEENGYRSELDELLYSVDDTLQALAGLTSLLLQNADRNRPAYAISNLRPVEFGQHDDAIRIAEKYPKLADTAELLRRLSEASTQRRQFLAYARDRAKITSVQIPPSLQVHANQAMNTAVGLSPIDTQDPTSNSPPSSEPVLSGRHSESSSLFELDDVEETETSSEGSVEIATTSDEESEDGAGVPKLNDIAEVGRPFLCPYCHNKVLFRKQSYWRKHVFADLKAYVCTIPDCSENGLFESKHDWIEHERKLHRRTWTCPICPTRTYTSRDAAERHFLQTHNGDQASASLVSTIIDAASPYTQDIGHDSCCFCETWTNERSTVTDNAGHKGKVTHRLAPINAFFDHVGGHLEEYALMSTERYEKTRAADQNTVGDHSIVKQASTKDVNDDTQRNVAAFPYPGSHGNDRSDGPRSRSTSPAWSDVSRSPSPSITAFEPLESRFDREADAASSMGDASTLIGTASMRGSSRAKSTLSTVSSEGSSVSRARRTPVPDRSTRSTARSENWSTASTLGTSGGERADRSYENPFTSQTKPVYTSIDSQQSGGKIGTLPNCAICGCPPYPECPHEGERLELALNQSFERWSGFEAMRTWVLNHSRSQIIATFHELRAMREKAHENYLQTLPYYTLYKRYKERPPLASSQLTLLLSQIRQANNILQQGVDQDWRTSCQRYPEVLDYYWSQVRYDWPSDKDDSIADPKFGSRSSFDYSGRPMHTEPEVKPRYRKRDRTSDRASSTAAQPDLDRARERGNWDEDSESVVSADYRKKDRRRERGGITPPPEFPMPYRGYR